MDFKRYSKSSTLNAFISSDRIVRLHSYCSSWSFYFWLKYLKMHFFLTTGSKRFRGPAITTSEQAARSDPTDPRVRTTPQLQGTVHHQLPERRWMLISLFNLLLWFYFWNHSLFKHWTFCKKWQLKWQTNHYFRIQRSRALATAKFRHHLTAWTLWRTRRMTATRLLWYRFVKNMTQHLSLNQLL